MTAGKAGGQVNIPPEPLGDDHALDNFGSDLRTLALTINPAPEFVAALRQEVALELTRPVLAKRSPVRIRLRRPGWWILILLASLVTIALFGLPILRLEARPSIPTPVPSGLNNARSPESLPQGALARLGRGQALSFALAPSGSLAVGSSVGICLYQPDLTQQWCVWSQAAVTRLAFNPDGSMLAAGQSDGRVLVLDPSGGQIVDPLSFGTDSITGLAWMPGPPILLVASTRSAQVKAWDWNSSDMAWDSGRVAGQSLAMASAPRSSLLAFATDAGIVVLEAQQGRQLHRIDTGDASPLIVAFSEDGRYLAAGMAASIGIPSAAAWRVTDWDETGSWSFDSAATSVALGRAGLMAMTSAEGDVWVGSLGRPALERVNEAQPGSPLAWSPDGESLYMVRKNGPVERIAPAASRSLALISDYSGPVDTVAWTEQGSILSLYSNTYLGMWEAVDGEPAQANPVYIRASDKPVVLESQPSFAEENRFLAWSSDGGRFLLASGEQVVLIDTKSGREAARLAPHSARVVKGAFSPDSTQVVTADQSARLRIWDSTSGSLLRTLEPLTIGATVTGLGWLPEISPGVTSSSLAVTWLNSARFALDLVDPVSGRDRRLPNIKESLGELAWSRDGRWVASVVGRGVLVWDVNSREVRYNFAIDPVDWRSVNLAFSPDGRFMATGGRNIILWSLDSGEKEEVFMGHNAVVSGLSFSPDSTRLVSGSVDGTLVVWDSSILPP